MAWVDVEAPASRWLCYVAVTMLVGVVGALWSLATARAADPSRLARAGPVLLRIRQGSAILLIASILLLIVAQVRAWFGPGAERDLDHYAVVARSTWGRGWIDTAVAGGVAAMLGLWPSRGRGFAITSVLAAAIATAAVPMTGHGATAGRLVSGLHALHVAGGGLWIGSLAAVLWAAWPLWRDGPVGTLAPFLTRFSRIALGGAFTLGISGVVLTLVHVPAPLAMAGSDYGQTLLVKMGVTLTIAGLGWRNWQRLAPAVASPAARRALVRAAVVEVALGVGAALAAAAWLSTLSPPID